MPAANRFRRRNRAPRKQRRRRSKLADKKINTLVEKRMTEIARKATASARSKSYKDYFVGSYNLNGWPGTYHDVTKNPDDLLTSLYVVPVLNEDLSTDVVGKRLNNKIWIKGFSVTGRLRLEGDSSGMCQQDVQFTLLSQRRQVDPIQSDIGPDLPTPVVFNSLSGARMSEDQIEDYKGITVLAKKVIAIRPQRAVEWSKNFSMSHYFKRPQLQHFSAADTAGTNPLTRTYWLAIHCDSDHSPTAGFVLPQVVLTARCHYFTE